MLNFTKISLFDTIYRKITIDYKIEIAYTIN